jgi:membrane protease YdiL (CAAX protease family)
MSESILDKCYFQELIKFDPTKKTSSFGTILFVAIASVIVNNLVYNIGMKKFATADLHETLEDEYADEIESTKDKQISPVLFGISELLNSGIYAPLVEELFFRFFFLKLILIKMFGLNIHKANIIHAIIFGAMHMTNAVVSDQQINRTIIQSIMSGIGGLLAGYTYIYTNSIFTPLIAHIINNTIAAGNQVIDYAETYSVLKEKFSIHFG